MIKNVSVHEICVFTCMLSKSVTRDTHLVDSVQIVVATFFTK